MYVYTQKMKKVAWICGGQCQEAVNLNNHLPCVPGIYFTLAIPEPPVS